MFIIINTYVDGNARSQTLTFIEGSHTADLPGQLQSTGNNQDPRRDEMRHDLGLRHEDLDAFHGGLPGKFAYALQLAAVASTDDAHPRRTVRSSGRRRYWALNLEGRVAVAASVITAAVAAAVES
jgi:hypothetical protein